MKAELYSKAKLPTDFGEFDIYIFKEENLEHSVLVMPWNKEPVIVRIHSKCLTSEVFGSLRCDCGEQLQTAQKIIGEKGGLLIYLDQEGRGIGMANKIAAYNLQDKGMDTVDANIALGFPEDMRDFSPAVEILGYFNISSVLLMTNHPGKIKAVKYGGMDVERIPMRSRINPHNIRYLKTKKERMNQDIDLDKKKIRQLGNGLKKPTHQRLNLCKQLLGKSRP